ncbi:MAG: hypothetical protein ACK50Q_16200 [Labrys sp. (in: a-proteobacteria)]
MTDAERRGRGRPSSYSDELAEQVLDLIAAGSRWREVEEQTGISTRSIMRWTTDRPDFARALAEAKAAGAEVWSTLDVLGREDDPQRARVLLEQARWLASKWSPSTFGDRVSIELEHRLDLSGALADAQRRVAGVVVDVTPAEPQPQRLGTSITTSWPQLADQPEDEPRADWLD